MKKVSESESASESSSHIPKELKRNLETIDIFIKGIAEKYSVPFDEILSLLGKKSEKTDIKIPTSILRDENFGILEAVAKYLKEDLNLTYHKIAVLLNRDDRVIWVTYNKARKKKKERFAITEPNHWIPISVFADADLGPLESLSKYLVDELKMDYNQIAELLNRDSRSIWACYKRAVSKKNE